MSAAATSTTLSAPRAPWRVGLLLGAVAAAVNVAVWLVARAGDAALVVDMNGTAQSVPVPAVVAMSLVPVLLAALVHGPLVRRVPAAARLWVPVVVLLGLLSLAGAMGGTDTATRVSLGAMHLAVTAVAAFAVPRLLGGAPTTR